jgi:hypothetical protein
VYVPVPPAPLSKPVITVPGAMPGPVMGMPTASEPALMLDTVSVDPDMEPTRLAADTEPSAPVEVTLCELGTDTVYVPTPPVPVPKPDTTVPAAMPGPLTGVPTAIVPEVTALTVIVVPAMDAENSGTVLCFAASKSASKTALGKAAIAASRVFDEVGVKEAEEVEEGVPVGVTEGVGDGVCMLVPVLVREGVCVGVNDPVPLPVLVGEGVGVDVGVGVGVGAAVPVAAKDAPAELEAIATVEPEAVRLLLAEMVALADGGSEKQAVALELEVVTGGSVGRPVYVGD